MIIDLSWQKIKHVSTALPSNMHDVKVISWPLRQGKYKVICIDSLLLMIARFYLHSTRNFPLKLQNDVHCEFQLMIFGLVIIGVNS